MEYPAELQGASRGDARPQRRRQDPHPDLDLRPPDHPGRAVRASSCAAIHQLLLGEDDFYDDIFRVAAHPLRADPLGAATSPPRHDDRPQQDRPRAGAHPRLPRARAPDGRHRPARVPAAHATPTSTSLSHGLTLWDLDREFATGGFGGQPLHAAARHPRHPARLVLPHDRHRVHAHPGPRAARVDPGARRACHTSRPPREEQLRILRKLNEAEAFETFLQTKYVGQKRFSLEGGESVIPLLDEVLQQAAARTASTRSPSACRTAAGSTCWPTSPASRYGQIFREFEGNYDLEQRAGLRRREVPPRHRGHVHAPTTASTIEVYLAANPSHLEAVNPVLEGIVRAKQDLLPARRAASPCCRC